MYLPIAKRSLHPSTLLANMGWLSALTPFERDRVFADLIVGHLNAGDLLFRVGEPPDYWYGLIDGLLKMSNDNVDGKAPITYTGFSAGGWFGEGTLLKHEAFRYNIHALRRSTVAALPSRTFHWLVQNSLPFNHFLLRQLNERLGQFIAAREIDRMSDPDLRVARSLAMLFNPILFPGVKEVLPITQQELGYLVGLSRQRTNESLQHLQQQGLITLVYGGVRVIDLKGLLMYGTANARTLSKTQQEVPHKHTDHICADLQS